MNAFDIPKQSAFAGDPAFYGQRLIQHRGAPMQIGPGRPRVAVNKEALIAYAVIDDKRPGRMPCPAITEDGSSPLLTRNDCDGWVTGGPDVYSGWLPWKTLDLKEASDEEGLKFRYATTRLFAGDRPSPPLNSETLTSLRLDVSAGTASNDIAAIIIATYNLRTSASAIRPGCNASIINITTVRFET